MPTYFVPKDSNLLILNTLTAFTRGKIRLKKLLEDYAATGLPPAYLPKDEMSDEEERHDP